VDATALALDEIGRPVVNTCMLGCWHGFTGWVKLESVISSLDMNFEGKLLQKNADLVRRGYEGVTVFTKE